MISNHCWCNSAAGAVSVSVSAFWRREEERSGEERWRGGILLKHQGECKSLKVSRYHFINKGSYIPHQQLTGVMSILLTGPDRQKCKVSSTLNKSSEFSSKNMFSDGDSCWNSDQVRTGCYNIAATVTKFV